MIYYCKNFVVIYNNTFCIFRFIITNKNTCKLKKKINWLNHKTVSISSYTKERKVGKTVEINRLGILNEKDKTVKLYL